MVLPEIEITVKWKNKTDEKYIVKSSDDTAKVIRNYFNSDTMLWREEFLVIALNRANRVIAIHKHSSGATDYTTADIKMIAQTALLSHASSVIVAHNHPSGNKNPSDTDKKLSSKIKAALALLDIELLDSLIITEDNYYSMRDEGVL
jgi:DNA repair protein RadC